MPFSSSCSSVGDQLMSQFMTVLALDFDGVICDSAEEVLQTALEAWSEVAPNSRLQTEVESRPESRAAFERLVPLGNRAEDFGVALHVISNGLDVRTQEEYDRIRDGLGTDWLGHFHQLFYRTRHRLRNDDPECWLGYHRTYPTFIEVLERHQHHTTLAVVTAKDGASVRLLLKHFEIDRLFRDGLILDKETGVAKTSHLRILAGQLNCNPSQITFVDDKLNHLVSTASLGVRGVLAAWGHNTTREHEAARHAGFPVATLETAEALLFGD